jgi:hypothetical protein
MLTAKRGEVRFCDGDIVRVIADNGDGETFTGRDVNTGQRIDDWLISETTILPEGRETSACHKSPGKVK